MKHYLLASAACSFSLVAPTPAQSLTPAWQTASRDYNSDGVVDLGDYTIWRANFFDTASQTSRDLFNGSTLVSPGPADATTVWISVPIARLFVDAADYWVWRSPFTAAAALPGDYNGDAVVDAADFNIWSATVLDAASLQRFLDAAGDLNQDNAVDGRDFFVWRDNLGAPGNSNTPNGVPGDFDLSGSCSIADFDLWKTNLNAFSAPANDWWWAIDNAAPAVCGADLTGDGLNNLDDVSLFASNLPDLNADTTFNLDDVSLFVAEFLAGCP